MVLWLPQADAAQFRTRWFVESVPSDSLIVRLIRSLGPSLRSLLLPGLILLSAAVIAITLGRSVRLRALARQLSVGAGLDPGRRWR